MDPLSATASIVNVLDTVTKLSKAIAKFRHDYNLAEEDLATARNHALLLEAEIRGLEAGKQTGPSSCEKSESTEGGHGSRSTHAVEKTPFEHSLAVAQGLLRDIEASFPLRAEPHTWASKVRWAIKDKKVLDQLKVRLQSTESTLQGILSTEQLRMSHLIYNMLQKQQISMDKIEGDHCSSGIVDINSKNNYTSGICTGRHSNQTSSTSSPRPISPHTLIRTNKTAPWITGFDHFGISVRLAAFANEKQGEYRGSIRVPLFDTLLSIQIGLSLPTFTFNGMLHSSNIIPSDSKMALACRTGDFEVVRDLLKVGSAHGSDTISSGWPMLDYAIESGSTRLVSLLLENGAKPNATYGDHNMSPLQAAFLRGKLDIARVLLNRGADIEHVDNGGYSVLSYLWVVDSRHKNSLDFMDLCQTHQLDEVNACDNRGWTALHRAAAIGTAGDIEAFLRTGASLDLRADWYGWTPLFFAASHDNEDTFRTIVRHLGPAAYQSLDGDGWSLLHCCVYFGAPKIMRILLQNGIDVNKRSLPSPLPEDPELSYRELTAADIATYIGPNRCQMFMNALSEAYCDTDAEDDKDIFWNTDDRVSESDAVAFDKTGEHTKSGQIYGAEDIDSDRWTLLYWACYNGSPKVKDLLLLRGIDAEHRDAILLEENPTLFPPSYSELFPNVLTGDAKYGQD